MSTTTTTTRGTTSQRRFEGKVVIVTGSSAGIGADAAVEFGKEGAALVVHGQNEQRLEKTVEALRKAGVPDAKICKVIGSMEDDATPGRIIQAAVNKFGKIDVLINNAGQVGLLSKWKFNSLEVCDHLYRVNFRSVVELTQLALPHLSATRGNVVNVSSISAQRTYPPDDAFYCCMKAALEHFTRLAASEYGAKGVRINAVAPGPIESMIRAADRMVVPAVGTVADWAQHNTVLGRVGQPGEVSTVLKFLASDEASFVTGAVWVVDGGVMVKSPA